MNKSLVLDIDGVLIRDSLLLAHVRSNVVEYVRKKVPWCKEPARLNTILYKKYGHTARGLQQAFKIDASDFDENVYDGRLHDHLWSVLSGTEFQEEAKIIHEISQSGWDVTLFSNSPLYWSLPVQQAISDQVNVYHDGVFFKPDVRSYVYFDKDRKHLFVDDSIVNLKTARTLPNWIPVHYRDEEDPLTTEFPSVSSVWELGLMCHSINDWTQGSAS
jgi:hypothetical protein